MPAANKGHQCWASAHWNLKSVQTHIHTYAHTYRTLLAAQHTLCGLANQLKSRKAEKHWFNQKQMQSQAVYECRNVCMKTTTIKSTHCRSEWMAHWLSGWLTDCSSGWLITNQCWDSSISCKTLAYKHIHKHMQRYTTCNMRDKTKYIHMYVDKWCLRPKVCFRNSTHIDWEILVNCRYTYVCVKVCGNQI